MPGVYSLYIDFPVFRKNPLLPPAKEKIIRVARSLHPHPGQHRLHLPSYSLVKLFLNEVFRYIYIKHKDRLGDDRLPVLFLNAQCTAQFFVRLPNLRICFLQLLLGLKQFCVFPQHLVCHLCLSGLFLRDIFYIPHQSGVFFTEIFHRYQIGPHPFPLAFHQAQITEMNG